MIRTALLCLFVLGGAQIAKGDTCLDFAATPGTYTAPAGGTFTVFTTYTNCGADTTIIIGGGFGSDESVNISQISFYDPLLFLAPGESITAAFADYTWDPNAPGGFVWNPNINAEYAAEFCSGSDCNIVGGGFAFTNFSATVEQPVPEPATLLLLSTGVAGIAFKARRRKTRLRV